MAAAFLAPLAEPVTAQIEAEACTTLAVVFRIARKQRRRLLKAAERDGRDMTGALVELVPDAEVRRIISHTYASIGAPVRTLHVFPPAAAEPPESPLSASGEASGEPPDPPAPPPLRSTPRRMRSKASTRSQILHLTPEPAEDRIRALLAAEPGLSIRALAKQAGVSESTASKYRRLV